MKSIIHCIKNLMCRIGLGSMLIEYCNACGVRQPLVWWCRDTRLWTKVNGTEGGALCPQCFTEKANRLGIFIRWYPRDEDSCCITHDKCKVCGIECHVCPTGTWEPSQERKENPNA